VVVVRLPVPLIVVASLSTMLVAVTGPVRAVVPPLSMVRAPALVIGPTVVKPEPCRPRLKPLPVTALSVSVPPVRLVLLPSVTEA